jgi:hypothetical protein
MASSVELEKLFGRAAADKEFRAHLVADPNKAAKDLGITITAEQAASIKGAKHAIDVHGQSTDLRLKAAAASLIAGVWI